MAYKTLLFDLDNTLLDFSTSESLSLDNIYNLYFKPHLDIDAFKNHYHLINKEIWSRVELGRFTTHEVKTERFKLLGQQLQLIIKSEEIANTYEQGLVEFASWYPGVKETLLTLKNQYQIGIITNGLAEVQQGKYQLLGLKDLCDCYVVSDIIGISKPNKKIFEQALNHFNRAHTDALMIGDSLTSDYQGAINANLDFCWINSQNEKLPNDWIPPKYVIESVTQLPLII